MATKTFNVTKQYMADTIGGSANPGDLHIPLGPWDANSWVGRALLYAPVSFTGMVSINSARIYLKANVPTSGWHAKGTTSSAFDTRRKTSDWSETSGGVSSAVDELWGGSGASLVDSGFVDAPDAASTWGALTDGTWYYIDITESAKDWFGGAANYGIMIYCQTSEAAGASQYGRQFWSRHSSGNVPYIWIDYNTNTAPNAPTTLTPTGNAVVHTGTTFAIAGKSSDPDAGDYQTAHEVYVYKDDGTTVAVHGPKGGASGGTSFTRNLSLASGNNGNSFYKWKARTWDKNDVVGPWSALQRFKANTPPNVPTGLAEETDTLTPVFSGGYSDYDPGDGMAAVQIEVYTDALETLVWASGDLVATGTTWSKTYAGTALSWNATYKWRVRTKDSNGAYSVWTAWRMFVPIQPAGPTLSPRTTASGVAYGGKQNSVTPTLTLTYAQQFKNHEIYVYTTAAGTTVAYSFTGGVDYALVTSKTQVTGTLVRGSTYFWKARVKLNDGTWTEWGGLSGSQIAASFYINALPTAPTGLDALNSATAAHVIRPSDGISVVSTVTPVLRAIFNDPDIESYGDTPSAHKLEIYNDSSGALVHSNENLAPTYNIPMTYTVPAATLVFETTYKVRWQFQDNSDVYGAWSSYLRFKVTQSSTIATVTLTSPVTSPSFTVTWDHTSPAGKVQGLHRIRVFDKGPTGVPSYQTAMMGNNPVMYFRLGGNPLAGNIGSAAGVVITATNGPLLDIAGLLVRDEDTAVQLDGVNDWLAVTSAPALSGGMSLVAWGSTTTDKNEYLVARGGNAYLRRTTGGAVVFSWFDGGGVQRTISSAANALPADGTVHSVIGTHTGANVATLYVDGVQVATSSAFTGWTAPTAGQWGIGSASDGLSDWWQGVLDEVTILNGALSAANVTTLQSAGTNPQNYPSPIQVYDSGYIASSLESHTVPGGYLVNSHDYRIDIQATDTDNI